MEEGGGGGWILRVKGRREGGEGGWILRVKRWEYMLECSDEGVV